MTPSIALLLCSLFCFAVFWSERRRRAAMDWRIWLPTIWFMRCASRNISSWLSGGQLDPAGGIDMYFLLGLIVLAFHALGRRPGAVRQALRNNRWVILMYAYMFVSVLWSDSPVDSFKRWVRTSGDLAMALILVTEKEPLEAIKEVFRRGCMLLIPFSVVLSKYLPALGRLQEKDWAPDTWIGVATHKNTLGMLCLVSAFYFLARILSVRAEQKWSWKQVLQKSRLDLLYLGMSLYLLFGIGAHSNSVSSTSKLCFILAVGLLIGLQRFRHRPGKIGPLLAWAVTLAVSAQLFLSVFFDSSIRAVVARSQGKDPGLAERTDLWSDLIKMGEKDMMLGSGYASFWTGISGEKVRQVYTWGPHQAHNGYVETYLNLGLVGVVLLAIVIIVAIRGAVKTCKVDFDYGVWRFILLACCLAENYAEAGFPRPTHVLWFIFLVTALSVPRPVMQTVQPVRNTARRERIHPEAAYA